MFSTDYPLAYAADDVEYEYLLNHATDLRWVKTEKASSGDWVILTPVGWEQLQRRPRIESTQGFVVMSFKEVMKHTYDDAIEPADRDDCGFSCRRIDAKEYDGAVMDEIKAEIRGSRFVVAELTNRSNGVCFEAGLADGLGIPVIWTCSEEDASKTHFDTKHLNQIRWVSRDDLRKRLTNRIRATIGEGPFTQRD